MAAKKTIRKKKTSQKVMTTEVMKHALCEAALKIAAEEGWPAVGLERLATEVGVPLGKVIAVCPTRASVVGALFRRVDDEVLSQVRSIDREENARDRLFDILMSRFDVVQAHREGYVAIVRDILRQPSALAGRIPGVLHSMALMLIAAGIKADGLVGMARVHALALAYASVLRVWLKDDSADMAQTMSALDKVLGRLESIANMTVMKRQRKKTESKDPES